MGEKRQPNKRLQERVENSGNKRMSIVQGIQVAE